MIFETTPILKAIAAVDICNRSFHQIKRWETTMRPKNGEADNFDPNEMTWRNKAYIFNSRFDNDIVVDYLDEFWLII